MTEAGTTNNLPCFMRINLDNIFEKKLLISDLYSL